jgi:hypothetical protein
MIGEFIILYYFQDGAKRIKQRSSQALFCASSLSTDVAGTDRCSVSLEVCGSSSRELLQRLEKRDLSISKDLIFRRAIR